MTIAVVSTFVKPPIQEMSVGSAGTPATEHMNSGLDFASMLLGQPFVAAKPLPDDDQPDNSELAIADAGTAATATDPQFLATLGFPPAQQPGSSVLATNPEIDPSRSVRTEALLPSTPTRIAPETPEIRAQTGDERQPAASTPLASDDKPAKFAVAEFAVPSAVPSAEPSGWNTPELRNPASGPGTLAAWPSPKRSGSNQPEPPFAPASSPSTLASLPGNFVSGAALTHDIPHHLQTPLHDPSWASDLGQKLLWFASNEKQLAQLTLHPPQLGSIEITLNLDKDGASAHFVSLNADVRGAIETAVPRLREMFAGTGIALGQVSVGSESFRQQSDGQPEPQHRPRPLADNAILGSDSVNVLSGKTFVTQRGRGLIDIFA